VVAAVVLLVELLEREPMVVATEQTTTQLQQTQLPILAVGAAVVVTPVQLVVLAATAAAVLSLCALRVHTLPLMVQLH
jgi:hypothetical protein